MEFEYGAASRDEYKLGRISADTESAAETLLEEQGLKVLTLKRRRPVALGYFTQLFADFQTSQQMKMSTSEKILFTGQLSSMVKAGLPLIEALSAFVEQGSNKGAGRVISAIVADLQSGMKFSDAMAAHPKIFSPTYIAVIKAGESSGTLAESLSYLSSQLRREHDLLNKVRSALIYPVVVMVAMVAVLTFMSIAVVPKIVTFAQSTGQELPFYTLALVAGVNIIIKYWYLVILALVALAFGLLAFARSKRGTRLIGATVLRLPIIGKLAVNYNLAQFARSLGGFYLYGVNIIASFDILAKSMGNPLYQDSCYRIKKRLTMGQTLADSVGAESNLYPTIMVRLIKGAEKTGELGGSLEKLATFYEEELEVSLRNTIALIEPALIFVLGFGVLGLAMAVIVPIYKVTSTLK